MNAGLAEDPVSASFLVQAVDTRMKYVLREYLPPPQTNGQALLAFRDTARLLEQIRSPRIITPLSHFEQDSRFYTVEDQLWEETLLQEMQTRGPYSEQEVLGIAREVADLLKELNTGARPVHHGEISTSTVARRKGDRALMLMDFALLKDATQVIKANGHRRIANRHLAPHQPDERREGLISAATDVYSLGAMMIGMVSGKPVRENYDEKKRTWDWRLMETEGTQLLLEAMTLAATGNRLKNAEYVFPVLEWITSGQGHFDNGRYGEAAGQWKQAYDKAKTPALKSKIEAAESRLTDRPPAPVRAASEIDTQALVKRPFQDPALIVARTDAVREDSGVAGDFGARIPGAVRTGDGEGSAAAVSAPGAASKGTGEAPSIPLAQRSGERAGNGRVRIDRLSLGFRRLWARAKREAKQRPLWVVLSVAGIILSIAGIVLSPAGAGIRTVVMHWINDPPVLSLVKPGDPIVKMGAKVELRVDVEDPDSSKFTFDWNCTPPGKIEGNENHDSNVVTLNTEGLTEAPPQFEFLVTVTAADGYDKSKPVSARVRIVPKESTPGLKEIVATPARVRPGDSVNLKAIVEDPDSRRPGFTWKCEPPAMIVGDGPVVVLRTAGINARSTRELLVSVTVTNESGGSVTGNLVIPLEPSRRKGTAKPASSLALDPFNNPPIIAYLQPGKIDVQAGEAVTIAATAVDQNNDNLTYEWEPRQYIESNGANAVLNTSGIRHPQAYPLTVTLTVKDGRGGSASQRVVITVRPAGDKKE